MSAAKMIEVAGVLYTPEDAKRLELEADPLPPVEEKQVLDPGAGTAAEQLAAALERISALEDRIDALEAADVVGGLPTPDEVKETAVAESAEKTPTSESEEKSTSGEKAGAALTTEKSAPRNKARGAATKES